MMLRPFALLVALGLGAAAQAHEFEEGDLAILHPFAIETAARATTGAGYFEVRNDGDQADALIGVEAAFPKVALHEAVETDGMMTMQPIERVEIAPGETLTLAPGEGGHVMFMGIDAPFEVGARFPAKLIFERAGAVEVEFVVELRPEPGADHSTMDHSTMDHSGMTDAEGGMDHGTMDHGEMNHGEMEHGADAAAE